MHTGTGVHAGQKENKFPLLASKGNFQEIVRYRTEFPGFSQEIYRKFCPIQQISWSRKINYAFVPGVS